MRTPRLRAARVRHDGCARYQQLVPIRSLEGQSGRATTYHPRREPVRRGRSACSARRPSSRPIPVGRRTKRVPRMGEPHIQRLLAQASARQSRRLHRLLPTARRRVLQPLVGRGWHRSWLRCGGPRCVVGPCPPAPAALGQIPREDRTSSALDDGLVREVA